MVEEHGRTNRGQGRKKTSGGLCYVRKAEGKTERGDAFKKKPFLLSSGGKPKENLYGGEEKAGEEIFITLSPFRKKM